MKTNNPKTRYKVRNWHQYNKALISRGSLTLWIDEALLEEWRQPAASSQPGRPLVFPDQLILLLGTLREAYHLPLRQTIGFAGSILQLMHVMIALPDYTTLDRRLRRLHIPLHRLPAVTRESLVLVVDSTGVKVSGEGEWKVRLHGKTSTRVWRKVHIAQDHASWEIVGLTMTDGPAVDHQQVPELLDQLPTGSKVAELLGDGAYDRRHLHLLLQSYGGRVIAPPQRNARLHPEDSAWRDRDKAVAIIQSQGREAWAINSGYHRRSRVETTMFRYKRLFGDQLQTKTDSGQLTQLRLRSRILNVFTSLGMPDSYLANNP